MPHLDLPAITTALAADPAVRTRLTEAYSLPARAVDIGASGASKAWVRVSDHLKVDASGSCHIYYKGDPSTDIRLSGASKVLHE